MRYFKIFILCLPAIFITLFSVCPPFSSAQRIVWEKLKELRLKDPIIDMAISPDERWLYVLTPGKIVAYSVKDEEIVQVIPVEKGIDRIVHTPSDNALIVSSKAEKKIQVFRIDHVYTFSTEGRPYIGDKDAKVTISIFSHYQCPFCAKIVPQLESLIQQYPKGLKIVFKGFPSYHEITRKASAAAIAAFQQGRFMEMHHALHHTKKPLPEGKIEELADSVGLDMDKFLTALEAPETYKMIDEDIKEGLDANIHSVPSFFVDGVHLKNERLNEIFDLTHEKLGNMNANEKKMNQENH